MNSNIKTSPHPERPDIIEITAPELSQHLGQFSVIDVRGEDEYIGELGHIAGAKHLQLDQLPMRMNEIPNDGNVVFICKVGGRSARAVLMAQASGHKNVFNLQGGMLAWNASGLPVER